MNLIESFKPDLVLFPGDITGDGSCGHGFHHAFILLLKALEKNKTHSLFIKGNHDIDKYYIIVQNEIKNSKYIHELSLKEKTIYGIKFFGIPYEDSCKNTSLKKFAKKAGPIDILLAHSDLKSRPFLFDFDTSIICTGHFDNKLSFIDNKLFVSISNQNSPRNYCCIEYLTKNDFKSKYYLGIGPINSNQTHSKFSIIKSELKNKKYFQKGIDLQEDKQKKIKPESNNSKKLEKLYKLFLKDNFENKKTLLTEEIEANFVIGNEFKDAMEKMKLVKLNKVNDLTKDELNIIPKMCNTPNFICPYP